MVDLKEKVRKLADRVEKLERENEKLKQREREEPSKNDKNGAAGVSEDDVISRRGFLKKLGLGAAGFGALSLTPASALNVKGENLSILTGTDSEDLQEYFRVNQGGSGGDGTVEILNTDLLVQQDIQAADGTTVWDSDNDIVPKDQLEEHGNAQHEESYTTTDDNLEEFSSSGNEGEVPISQGDGTVSMGPPPGGGGFENIEVFESDDAFDASDIDKAFVEVVGGGGGGGASQGFNEVDLGGGGAGGGYVAGYVNLTSETSVTVTVGSGGDGGMDGDNNADPGGDSKFGEFMTGNGGSEGQTSSFGTQAKGGTSSGGDISIKGEDGPSGGAGDAVGSEYVKSLRGGSSHLGDPQNVLNDMSDVSRNGQDAIEYGAGGNGGIGYDGATTDGGNGADGVVIIYY